MESEYKTISQLYSEHTGKMSDKWSRYLSEYDTLFEGMRSKPVSLLEIGVQNGGGLEIWAKYFRQGSKFVGCDINPECGGLQFEDPRIALVVGDANTDATEKEILLHSPQFNIVIDDGSHHSGDIVRSFLRYFPHLVDGGCFVAEDLHASYWQEYEGGLFNPHSSISFFKLLVDILNHEHWGLPIPPAWILEPFNERYGVAVPLEMLSRINSVQFVNSMCIVLKSASSDNGLGSRILSGTATPVTAEILDRDKTIPTSPSQERNPWSKSPLSLWSELDCQERELKEKEGLIQSLKAELNEQNETNARLEEEVLKYALSTSWKMTRLFRKFAHPLSRGR